MACVCLQPQQTDSKLRRAYHTQRTPTTQALSLWCRRWINASEQSYINAQSMWVKRSHTICKIYARVRAIKSPHTHTVPIFWRGCERGIIVNIIHSDETRSLNSHRCRLDDASRRSIGCGNCACSSGSSGHGNANKQCKRRATTIRLLFSYCLHDLPAVQCANGHQTPSIIMVNMCVGTARIKKTTTS